MNILAISGSLQSQSSNSTLIRHAAALCGNGLEVNVFDQLADVPHFNPELDGDEPPATVRTLRALASAADAILIATPEYAHEMPGSLKNALDWLVSSGELYGKPAAVLCVRPLWSAVRSPETRSNARSKPKAPVWSCPPPLRCSGRPLAHLLSILSRSRSFYRRSRR